MEYLVNISKRRAFLCLNEDISKVNDSDYQYAISIKEDTAYPFLHSPNTTKETSSIRRIQRRPIRRIGYIACEYSGRYQTCPTPRNSNAPYPIHWIRHIEPTSRPYKYKTQKRVLGTDDEDAHKHMRRVLEIIDLFYFPGVTHDAVMLRVFPITLKGWALRWKRKLLAGMINTWDLLEKEFNWQYCSPYKTARKLEEIRNFKQEMYKTLYQAWERYNDLLFKCPQHNLNNHQKV
ncbi:ribonuclease H-like domain-containing protein [Tanacetum coccineum]